MRCHVCGRGMAEGIDLHRQNKPGEVPAVWACDEHNRKPSDPVVQDISAAWKAVQRRTP